MMTPPDPWLGTYDRQGNPKVTIAGKPSATLKIETERSIIA